MDSVAVSSSSASPVSLQVRYLLSTIERYVGLNRKFKLIWLRTGAAEFPLLGGDVSQWTTERIYGQLGRFSVLLPGLVITEASLQYELKGNDLTLAAGFTLPGFVERLSPIHPQEVGSTGVVESAGSFSIMAVFSLLSVVWTLLHPRVTLRLPGSVELYATLVESGRLVIDFVSPPEIECIFGVAFTCTPNSLTLTGDAVKVQYKAGWFAREKEWQI